MPLLYTGHPRFLGRDAPRFTNCMAMRLRVSASPPLILFKF